MSDVPLLHNPPLDAAPINLTHHFLIAMPGLEDEEFAKSVVYVCEHTEQGALGLVINKPSEIDLKHLFEKVDLPLKRKDLLKAPVFSGGPVQTERGFILHDAMHGTNTTGDSAKSETVYASSMVIPGGLEMTTSRDVLESLSMGAGPKRVLVSLGYSSWGTGQLESELASNSWLTVAADTALIFDSPIEQRYNQALKLLGVEPWMLSSQAGRAVMVHEEIGTDENSNSVLPAAIPANLQSFIAFDFGLKRTGVAVGNRITDSAQGLATLKAEGNARWPLIEARIKEWQPDAIVIGVPYYKDGEAHDNTRRAQKFGRQLHARYKLPVFEVDERFSTTEALQMGAKDPDAAAACIILEQFLRSLT